MPRQPRQEKANGARSTPETCVALPRRLSNRRADLTGARPHLVVALAQYALARTRLTTGPRGDGGDAVAPTRPDSVSALHATELHPALATTQTPWISREKSNGPEESPEAVVNSRVSSNSRTHPCSSAFDAGREPVRGALGGTSSLRSPRPGNANSCESGWLGDATRDTLTDSHRPATVRGTARRRGSSPGLPEATGRGDKSPSLAHRLKAISAALRRTEGATGGCQTGRATVSFLRYKTDGVEP